MIERQHILPVGDEWVSLIETRALGQSRAAVLLIPPFAMHARDLFAVALALARNGFDCFRLDGRDTLGGGSGQVRHYRLSIVAQDIDLALDHLARSLTVPVLIGGMSISARPAIRVLSKNRPVGAVLLTPVVDIRSTLRAVLDGQDLFAEDEPEEARVLGKVMARGAFVPDAKANGWMDLAGTLEDLQRVDCPVAFLCGDEDPWVEVAAVKRAAAAVSGKSIFVSVSAASHELNRNPVVAMAYIRQFVMQCAALTGHAAETVDMPLFAEVIAGLSQRERRLGEPVRRDEVLHNG
jgi:pimeloyl-ACP methyl ester carboxylesterase